MAPTYRLKAGHATHFTSPDLYQRVMTLLESYRYRLHVRRFVVELFDRSVIEGIVRDGNTEREESPPSPEELRL
jgi:rapamycin-insensitive companion of mTOR